MAETLPAKWRRHHAILPGALPGALTGGATGAAMAFGQAPWGMWYLTLAGFVVLAVLLEKTSGVRRAAVLGWSAGCGYFAVALNWIVEPFLVDVARHGWMAPFALVLLAGGLALFWGLAFGLARAGGGARLAAAALVVTLPMAELLRAYVLTGFPWAMPAYIWLDLAPMQHVAWFGPHGLNVLTLLMTAGVWSLTGVSRAGAVAFGIAVWAVALGGHFLAPELRVAPSPTQETASQGVAALMDQPFEPGQITGQNAGQITGQNPGRVLRLIQPNAPQHLKWDPEQMPVFFERNLEMTAAPAENNAPRPELIIWPETAVPAVLTDSAYVTRRLRDAAGGVPMIVGMHNETALGYHNAMAYLDADGQFGAVYDKRHLVPFGEYMPFGHQLAKLGIHGLAATQGYGFAPGGGAQILDLGALGRVLPLICYEAVFPQDLNAAPEGADWILQITNDAWFGQYSGPWQHLAQARFRAVEQGRGLVRVANTGVTGVIDARGRMVAALPFGTAGFLDVTRPEEMADTLYRRVGDWPVLVFLLLAGCGLTLSKRRWVNSD